MDACLVDAIYYAGDGKARLREFVANALREAIRPSGTAAPSLPVPALFILSESLGSKMVFDVVKTMKQEKEARILRLANQGHTDDVTKARNDLEQLQQDVGRTVTLFMAANQIPILSVADAGKPGEGLAAFNELHSTGSDARSAAWRGQLLTGPNIVASTAIAILIIPYRLSPCWRDFRAESV